MAYNFPTAPVMDELYEGYKWNGFAWKVDKTGGSSGTTGVVTDASLSGDGTATLPLSIALVDGGEYVRLLRNYIPARENVVRKERVRLHRRN